MKVFARIRPTDDCESNTRFPIRKESKTTLSCEESSDTVACYKFDSVFDPSDSINALYEHISAPYIPGLFDRVSATIVLYGVTASGKTRTLFGASGTSSKPRQSGLLHYTMNELYDHIAALNARRPGDRHHCSALSSVIERHDNDYNAGRVWKWSVSVSAIEIYQESCRDLFTDSTVSLRDARADGDVELSGNMVKPADTCADAVNLLNQARQRATTAGTAMNAGSSRSHTVLLVYVSRRRQPSVEEIAAAGDVLPAIFEHIGRLYLCDLAGSERQGHAQTGGKSLAEAAKINNSLSVLSRCLDALRAKQRIRTAGPGQVQVPYRESKLTRLLQSPLQGFGVMSLVVCISPYQISVDDNVRAVKFVAGAGEYRNVQQSAARLGGVVVPPLNLHLTSSEASRQRNILQSVRVVESSLSEIRSSAVKNFTSELNILIEEGPRRLAYFQSELNLQLEWASLAAKQLCARTDLYGIEALCPSTRAPTSLPEELLQLRKVVTDKEARIKALEAELQSLTDAALAAARQHEAAVTANANKENSLWSHVETLNTEFKVLERDLEEVTAKSSFLQQTLACLRQEKASLVSKMDLQNGELVKLTSRSNGSTPPSTSRPTLPAHGSVPLPAYSLPGRSSPTGPRIQNTTSTCQSPTRCDAPSHLFQPVLSDCQASFRTPPSSPSPPTPPGQNSSAADANSTRMARTPWIRGALAPRSNIAASMTAKRTLREAWGPISLDDDKPTPPNLKGRVRVVSVAFPSWLGTIAYFCHR